MSRLTSSLGVTRTNSPAQVLTLRQQGLTPKQTSDDLQAQVVEFLAD